MTRELRRLLPSGHVTRTARSDGVATAASRTIASTALSRSGAVYVAVPGPTGDVDISPWTIAYLVPSRTAESSVDEMLTTRARSKTGVRTRMSTGSTSANSTRAWPRLSRLTGTFGTRRTDRAGACWARGATGRSSGTCTGHDRS